MRAKHLFHLFVARCLYCIHTNCHCHPFEDLQNDTIGPKNPIVFWCCEGDAIWIRIGFKMFYFYYIRFFPLKREEMEGSINKSVIKIAVFDYKKRHVTCGLPKIAFILYSSSLSLSLFI